MTLITSLLAWDLVPYFLPATEIPVKFSGWLDLILMRLFMKIYPKITEMENSQKAAFGVIFDLENCSNRFFALKNPNLAAN